MKYVFIHCTDLMASKNVYDLIKVYGYRSVLSSDRMAMRMYKDEYFDMIDSIPLMKEIMDDKLTITKIVTEE